MRAAYAGQNARSYPLVTSAVDRRGRAGCVGDRLVRTAEARQLQQLVEDDPVADAPAVTAEWMVRLVHQPLGQQGRELVLKAVRSAMMAAWAQVSPVITERRNSVIAVTSEPVPQPRSSTVPIRATSKTVPDSPGSQLATRYHPSLTGTCICWIRWPRPYVVIEDAWYEVAPAVADCCREGTAARPRPVHRHAYG